MNEEIISPTKNLIKNFEGFSSTPYFCPAGMKTIGYGHVIKKNELLDDINSEQADKLLEQDILYIQTRFNSLIKLPLYPHQIISLISFIFNVGIAAFERSTLRQKLNRGEFFDASLEFHRWVYAGSKKLPGLVRRRQIESDIFLGKLTK